jgi:hypothetical protein
MPNVRGDKRRTIVCPDDLWEGLGEYAAERSTTRGAVIREQTHASTGWQVRADNVLRGTYASKAKAELAQQQLIEARREAIESGEEPGEPA